MDFSTTTDAQIPTDNVALSWWPRSTTEFGEVVIQITLWCLCICTILGNVLVIIVFIRDRRLRAKIANLYILNLSIADLLVGFISLLVYNVYRHTGTWRFGEAACKFWLIMDFGVCSVSIWAIVLISYDRFMLITTGLEYDKLQTYQKFVIFAGLSWIFSISQYVFTLVGYDIFVKSSIDYTVDCDSDFLYKAAFVIYDVVIVFFIPVAMIIYFNIKLFLEIKRRSRGMPRNTASIEPTSSTGSSTAQMADEASTSHAPQRQGTTDIKKHRRAGIILALIVRVSSLCWLPCYTLTILSILGIHFSPRASVISFYIFYSNSAINPLLYVATNPRIREGIVKLIKVPYTIVAQLTQNI